ncbi:dihydroorotate dehydrogenase [Patescibacteria group bacterium]|nr:dihydroorotate dehydrogenase [Patescibacteria group bacterium]
MIDLSVEFCGVKFQNPIVLASGVLGVTGDSLAGVVRNGAGGATTKSLWPYQHEGHKNPTMFGTEEYFMNAVGIPDAGPEKAREEILRYREKCGAPLIANIVGGKMEDYAEIAAMAAEMKPDVIEVNISCPNVEDELGKPMACSVSKSAEVTRLVKEKVGDIPVTVKLSPNAPDIRAIAESVLDAGADAVTAINTLGPGLAIDIDAGAPILSNRVGGISGPALKPLAVKAVYDIYAARKCPIIGTGGVITGRDAIEMMMAGATLVGVGTAVYYRGQEVFGEIVREMNEWCVENGVSKISSLIGKIHA